MKKNIIILAIVAIPLLFTSVSYAGSDGSPGIHKATTIEKVEYAASPAFISEQSFVLVTMPVVDMIQPEVVAEKFMINEKSTGLPESANVPSFRKWRCYAGKEYCNVTDKNDRSRSPGLNKAKRSQKFKDVHRRL